MTRPISPGTFNRINDTVGELDHRINNWSALNTTENRPLLAENLRDMRQLANQLLESVQLALWEANIEELPNE